ncbi:MAG: hypothetical protein M3P00_09570, partial [Gemmatimonadota bacterium]|nr:hypothetical protein [Gemmatimonadota bacterium]
WQTINTESRWLGGVEIRPGGASWRWDPTERALTRGTAEKTRSSKSSARPTAKKAKPRKASRAAAKKVKPRTAAKRSTRKKK